MTFESSVCVYRFVSALPTGRLWIWKQWKSFPVSYFSSSWRIQKENIWKGGDLNIFKLKTVILIQKAGKLKKLLHTVACADLQCTACCGYKRTVGGRTLLMNNEKHKINEKTRKFCIRTYCNISAFISQDERPGDCKTRQLASSW